MEKEKFSQNLFKKVCETISSLGIRYETISEEPGIKIVHYGPCGQFNIIIFLDYERKSIIFMCPDLAKCKNSDEIFRIINQINGNILMGKLIYLEQTEMVSALLTIPFSLTFIDSSLVVRGLQTIVAIIDHTAPLLEDEKENTTLTGSSKSTEQCLLPDCINKLN